MEVYAEDDRSVAVTTSPSCVTAIVPSKKRSSLMRKIASGCVFWLGMALIGVVVIPTGILFGMIYLIARAMSFLTDKIEKG